MSDLSVYGFEDAEGNPSEFRTVNVIEAKAYARDNSLKLIEHIYEWTEQVSVEGYDYTDSSEEEEEEEKEEEETGWYGFS